MDLIEKYLGELTFKTKVNRLDKIAHKYLSVVYTNYGVDNGFVIGMKDENEAISLAKDMKAMLKVNLKIEKYFEDLYVLSEKGKDNLPMSIRVDLKRPVFKKS